MWLSLFTHSPFSSFPFYLLLLPYPFNIISSILRIWYWFSGEVSRGAKLHGTKQVFPLNKQSQSHPIDAANLHFMLILSVAWQIWHIKLNDGKRTKLIYPQVWWNMDEFIMCMAFKLNCNACTFNRINIRSIWHLLCFMASVNPHHSIWKDYSISC